MLSRTRIGLAVVLMVLVSADPISAAASSSRPSAAPPTAAALAVPGPAAAGHDYATDLFADPWDYSNSDDLLLDNSGPAMSLSSARIEGGTAIMHFASDGYLSPLWGGYNNRMSLARDGLKRGNALNAARYRGISFRAYSSRTVAAGLFWFTCPVNNTCGGGMSFTLKAGWNTYVLRPGASTFAGWPVAWAGSLTGLRLAVSPGSAGSNFYLDWFRAYEPNSGAKYNYSNPGAQPAEVVWDGDADPANNGAGGNWGVVEKITAPYGAVDLSALPPGTYRLGVKRSGAVPSWATVTLAAPLPRFITPNAVGDRDYAATALRNPWDMNGTDDLSRIGNAKNVAFSGGRVAATNTTNDPFANLRIGAGGIDTRVYRNLTITSRYDGPFDLRDVAGGGTMARVQWRRADGSTGQTSDILTYSGTRTLSFDMGLPDDQIVEKAVSNASFTSASRLTELRWDPNEDRGARRWYVDNVTLRSDFATTGSFPIVWQDAAYQPGGTATLIADTDRSGCNGITVASGVPVAQGSNTTVWNTSSAPKGRYWLCLRISRGSAVTSGYAGGVLVVGGPVVTSTAGDPIGSWDVGTLSGSRYRISGWAYDPSSPKQAINVDAYDTRPNGTKVGVRLTTGGARPDVTRAHSEAGPNTGFSTTLQLTGPGRHSVCLYAINIGAGRHRPLGCRNVAVGAQTGRLDTVRSAAVRILQVGGWAADPSAPTAAQNLRFTVTGPAGKLSGTGRTALARPDVARIYTWAGPNSGFAASVPTAGAGVNTVCASIVSVYPPLANTSLGCRTVSVRNAFGHLDGVTVVGRRLTVSGWALNPNRPSGPVQVHVYDSGPAGKKGTAGIMTTLARPDVLRAYAGYRGTPGFSASVPTTGAGVHQVCAFAITVGGGTGNTPLGCRSITVR